MNTFFAEEVTVTENGLRGSISADRAVARVNALDWQQIGKDLDEQGSALLPAVLSAQECQALAALYPNETYLPQPGRHGTARLRPRRVQVLQLSIAQLDPGSPYSALHSARAGGESLERGHGDRGSLPGKSPGFSWAMPRCGTAAAHAVAAPVQRGRFQLSASGSLWGARLPDTGSDPAF